MNSKILIAFVSGALIASGIVYLAVRPEPEPKPATQAVAPQPAPAVAAKTPVEAALPTAVATEPAPAREKLSPAPIREKPSAMPVHKERPAAVARHTEPASPVTEPSPAQQRETPPAAITPAPSQPPEPPEPVPVPTPQATPAPESNPPPAPQPEPEVRVPHTVTITAGTLLLVRLGETLSSAHNQQGDEFLATLDQPLIVDGFIIAERGSRVEGRVVEVEPPGHGRSNSHLGIALVKLSTSDGQHIAIRTEPYRKHAASAAGSDAAKVGAGAVIGAAIGAIAGGGKGAAIGAGAGGAAGAADVLLTHGKAAEIPVETRVSFRVAQPVTITERLN